MVRRKDNSMERLFAVLTILFCFLSVFAQHYVEDEAQEKNMLRMARQYRYGIIFGVDTRKAASIYI